MTNDIAERSSRSFRDWTLELCEAETRLHLHLGAYRFGDASFVHRQSGEYRRPHTVRAARTRQREWLEASRNVDHMYHLSEDFMV
jgi:hypothetical protein